MQDDQDTRIPSEDTLLRGVPPDQWSFEKNRPSTGALDTEELCTDWTRFRDADAFMDRHNRRALGHGLISFLAGMPRACGLIVRHDPNPAYEPDNEAHTLIVGTKKGSFTSSVKKPDKTTIIFPAQKLAD